jgi:hypothetical protein
MPKAYKLFGLSLLLVAAAFAFPLQEPPPAPPPPPPPSLTPTPAKKPFEPVSIYIKKTNESSIIEPTTRPPGNKELKLPVNPQVLGWNKNGAKANTPQGTVLIGGRRDSKAQGQGAFFNLDKLEGSDQIILYGAKGVESMYQVTEKYIYDADKVPWNEYFTASGYHRLVLYSGYGQRVNGVAPQRIVIVGEYLEIDPCDPPSLPPPETNAAVVGNEF